MELFTLELPLPLNGGQLQPPSGILSPLPPKVHIQSHEFLVSSLPPKLGYIIHSPKWFWCHCCHQKYITYRSKTILIVTVAGELSVQASSSYGPWVPHPFSPVGRCLPATCRCRAVRYKRQCLPGFCTMSWKVLVNPYPSSLHAEKCVTLPLVRGLGAEKCSYTPIPRVYILKSVLLFP